MAAEEMGLIRVQEADFEEVAARHVDFFLQVKGMSLIVGDAALNKAREVQQLVNELKAIGATDADIKLLGVQADASTGILGRHSSATYSLKAHCAKLENLPDYLGVITSQKNTTVNYLQWDYGDLRDVELRLLDRCIERANEKAQRIARGLNVTLAGVHRFTDAMHTQENEYETAVQNMQIWRRRLQEQGFSVRDEGARGMSYDVPPPRRVTVQELAMQIAHGKQVIVSVDIEYCIAPQSNQSGQS